MHKCSVPINSCQFGKENNSLRLLAKKAHQGVSHLFLTKIIYNIYICIYTHSMNMWTTAHLQEKLR